jgi:hypothetical protein
MYFIADHYSVYESMSNISDMSGNTAVPVRQKMDVACVIDIAQPENLAHRKCALEELKQACGHVSANLQLLQVSGKSENIFKFPTDFFLSCCSLKN